MPASLPRIVRHLRRVVDPPADTPDADLLARFTRHRDEAAFAALVHRHGPAVLAVCRRHAGHAQDAEDACQATFLLLARKAAGLTARASVAGWLCAAARNVARKARRAAARRAARESRATPAPRPDPD